LIRTFDTALNMVKPILTKYFEDSKFNEIYTTSRKEFENLLSQIPYVGGNENPLTESLINSAMIQPLLRKFEEEGLEFYEIGKLTYKLFEIFYEFIPPKDDIFTEESLNEKKESAKKSKLKKYPEDWVFDFIEGDGKTFTFGINYSECGVYKFYKSQEASHFMPIICLSDYAQARVYRYGLKRT